MLTIFIDESGTLPDPKDKFIVICGVSVGRIMEVQWQRFTVLQFD